MEEKVLTAAQLERGRSLALQEGELRWDWGDWAVDVAGPSAESTAPNGGWEKLRSGLDELGQGDLSFLVPSFESIRSYRDAASAIPPELRQVVRSIEAGRILGQRVKDLRERHSLIEELANDDGVVTVRAVRDWFEIRSKDGPVQPSQVESMDVEQKADMVETLTEDPEVRTTLRQREQRETEDAERRRDRSLNEGMGDPNAMQYERFVDALTDSRHKVRQALELAGDVDFDNDEMWAGNRREYVANLLAEIRQGADDVEEYCKERTLTEDEIREGLKL